jgi:hypothetical protein
MASSSLIPQFGGRQEIVDRVPNLALIKKLSRRFDLLISPTSPGLGRGQNALVGRG